MRARGRSGHNQGVNESASPPSDGARPGAPGIPGEGVPATWSVWSPSDATVPVVTARLAPEEPA